MSSERIINVRAGARLLGLWSPTSFELKSSGVVHVHTAALKLERQTPHEAPLAGIFGRGITVRCYELWVEGQTAVKVNAAGKKPRVAANRYQSSESEREKYEEKCDDTICTKVKNRDHRAVDRQQKGPWCG